MLLKASLKKYKELVMKFCAVIFAILRFRTETIKVKEMTYFFVIIGVSAINALSNDNASIMELAVANGSIILLLFILEYTISRTSSE